MRRPTADLADQTLPELMALAFRSRQDYQNLQNQVVGFKAIHAAYRSQRWPTLSFNGYYGTQTVTGVSTHGVMLAQGTLSIPIFREAGLRGGEDASQAQLEAANADLDSLRQQIEEQIARGAAGCVSQQAIGRRGAFQCGPGHACSER